MERGKGIKKGRKGKQGRLTRRSRFSDQTRWVIGGKERVAKWLMVGDENIIMGPPQNSRLKGGRNMNSNAVFEVGAPGVDTEKIVGEIQARVAKKWEEGVYSDARIARAERTNLARLRNEDQFLGFYLKCLRDAVFVDISDFTIRERRRAFTGLLVGFKKVIWKLLKFYTYRLWSQQNEVNGLLVTAIEGLDEKYAAKIQALEQQVRQLEDGKK